MFCQSRLLQGVERHNSGAQAALAARMLTPDFGPAAPRTLDRPLLKTTSDQTPQAHPTPRPNCKASDRQEPPSSPRHRKVSNLVAPAHANAVTCRIGSSRAVLPMPAYPGTQPATELFRCFAPITGRRQKTLSPRQATPEAPILVNLLWMEVWGLCNRPRPILVIHRPERRAALIRDQLFDLGSSDSSDMSKKGTPWGMLRELRAAGRRAVSRPPKRPRC